ncbi:MAG: hypothetical protein ACR2KJ_11110 [Jatrophihabitans sp.]
MPFDLDPVRFASPPALQAGYDAQEVDRFVDMLKDEFGAPRPNTGLAELISDRRFSNRRGRAAYEMQQVDEFLDEAAEEAARRLAAPAAQSVLPEDNHAGRVTAGAPAAPAPPGPLATPSAPPAPNGWWGSPTATQAMGLVAVMSSPPGQRFASSGRLRSGYAVTQVDALVDRVGAQLPLAEPLLTTSEFATSLLGHARPGYRTADVDTWLARVQTNLAGR